MAKTLTEILLGFVVVVVLVTLLGSGQTAGLVTTVTATVTGFGTSLRELAIALGVPGLIAGGIIAISPKHRAFGLEVVGGSLLALSLAALAPALAPWLTNHLATAAASIFKG